MSNAISIEIAVRVTERLNATDTWRFVDGGISEPVNVTQEFTAVRGYNPVIDLEDTMTLSVVVVPREVVSKLSGRGGAREETYSIIVSVQKRVDSSDVSTIDPLVELVEQIKDHFEGSPQLLTGTRDTRWNTGGVRCTGADIKPLFDHPGLHDKNLFTSMIDLAFAMTR